MNFAITSSLEYDYDVKELECMFKEESGYPDCTTQTYTKTKRHRFGKYNPLAKYQQDIIEQFIKLVLDKCGSKRIEQKYYSKLVQNHPSFTNVSFHQIYYTFKNKLMKLKREIKMVKKS
jgi:hypothetical protein